MDEQLLRAFRFRVKLRKSEAVESGSQKPITTGEDFKEGAPLGDGAFQECTGLEVEMDVQEYLEGGRNNGVIRQAGRAKYTNLVLKRGMFYGGPGGVNRELWHWIQNAVAGERPIPRYDGLIEVTTDRENHVVVATWLFDRGLPAKIRGPELNGKTGEIAIEELHIAHEGLRLVAS